MLFEGFNVVKIRFPVHGGLVSRNFFIGVLKFLDSIVPNYSILLSYAECTSVILLNCDDKNVIQKFIKHCHVNEISTKLIERKVVE